MDASTTVTLPGLGVKEARDSMRPEVQTPESDFQGTIWIVLPPESWRLRLEVV